MTPAQHLGLEAAHMVATAGEQIAATLQAAKPEQVKLYPHTFASDTVTVR